MKILAWKLDDLQKNIKRINNRAEKKNIKGRISLTVGEELQYLEHPDNPKIRVPYYEAELDLLEVYLAGWSFRAVVEPTPAGNLIRGYEDVPVQYRTLAECEHCSKIRSRKKYFILRNECEEYKMVGSTCLKDFTGLDPTTASMMAENFFDMLDSSGCMDGDGYPRGVLVSDLLNILSETAAEIRNNGWVSKSKAAEWDRIPTAYLVDGRVFDHQVKSGLSDAQLVNLDDVQLAKDTIAWMQSLEEKSNLSDYLHNLLLISKLQYVEIKHFPLACSAVASYQRVVSERVRAEQKTLASNGKVPTHYGEVGGRYKYKATVEKVLDVHSDYSDNYCMIKFLTEEGDFLVWFTSGGLTVGETYYVTATIKRHDEYMGIKQNIVTRCNCETEQQKQERLAVAAEDKLRRKEALLRNKNIKEGDKIVREISKFHVDFGVVLAVEKKKLDVMWSRRGSEHSHQGWGVKLEDPTIHPLSDDLLASYRERNLVPSGW